MSKIDAERDGIKWSYGAGRGSKTGAVIYHVPCDNCGRIHNRKTYTGNGTYWCDICKNLSQRSKKIKKEMETFEDKYDKRFSEAIKRLPKNKSYTEAISICEKCRTKNYAIGLDWKIIRIPADYITKNINKVLKYIKRISTQGTE